MQFSTLPSISFLFLYILPEVIFTADELTTSITESKQRACTTLRSLKKCLHRIQVICPFRCWGELQQQSEMFWSCFGCFYQGIAGLPPCSALSMKAETEVSNGLPI